MRRRYLTAATLVIAGGGVLSACGGQSTPAAQPGQQAAPTSATTTKAQVHRPKQVSLTGVDPCSSLTAAQQAQFQTHGPRPGTDEALNSPKCDFFFRAGNYRVSLVTNDNADSWSNGSRPGHSQAQNAVDGFPTVAHTVPDDSEACDVIVDTADGQYLVATARISPAFASSYPEKCTAAHQVAEAAMQTLLATH